MPLGAVHPLTGPVYVKGARPGDLLEVEFVEIAPQPWAFSAIMPGLGFLRDIITEPFLVHWQIADGWATSFVDPQWGMPRRFTATMGMPVDDGDDTNHAEDLTSAARHAVLNMMDLLQERGFSKQQAYVVCSVAVDLRISNVVDAPNYVVSALLSEDIFHSQAI